MRKKKLYRNNGSHASPTWIEVKEVRDLDIKFSPDKFDDSDRSSNFKLYDAGQIELGCTFKMTFRKGNLNCKHIRDSILECTATEYAAMYGDITESGSEGFRFYGKCFKGDHSQPLNDGDTVDVELAPTYFEENDIQIEPTFYEIA